IVDKHNNNNNMTRRVIGHVIDSRSAEPLHLVERRHHLHPLADHRGGTTRRRIRGRGRRRRGSILASGSGVELIAAKRNTPFLPPQVFWAKSTVTTLNRKWEQSVSFNAWTKTTFRKQPSVL
ncbi:unnamed protein product, partial [Arctogadus glacialis]